MPGLNLGEVLNPKSKERGILCNKCFMKSTHSMVMPTEIWQFSLFSLSLLHFPIRASGHTIEPCCSRPCLWSLIHHFSDIALLCLEEASRRDTTFPEFPPLCTSASNLLAALFHFFHPVSPVAFPFSPPFRCSVSLGRKMTPQCVGDESSHCSSGQPWPWLLWATSVRVCKPALLQRSIRFPLVVEAAGLRCLKISSRVRIPLKKGPRAIPYVLVIAHGEAFERKQVAAHVEVWCNFITLFRHLGHAMAFLAFNTLF